MWRRWPLPRWRLSVKTFLLLVIIIGLSMSLAIQSQRDARLRAQLRFLQHQHDEAIRIALEEPLQWQPKAPVTLQSLLVYIRSKAHKSDGILWSGLPIYVDPVGLQEAKVRMSSLVSVAPSSRIKARVLLDSALSALGLDYVIRDGLLTITSKESIDRPIDVTQ